MLISSAYTAILKQKMGFMQLLKFLEADRIQHLKLFLKTDNPRTIAGLLQASCTNGNYEAVRYLSSLDLGDRISYLPTRLAAEQGHLQILKHLVNSGFPVKQCALDFALENERIPAAKFLLERGIRTNHFCVTHLAAEGKLKALEILMDTEHEIKDEALIRAAEAGHIQVVRLLASKMDHIPEEAFERARNRGLWLICLILDHYGGNPRSSKYAWKKFVKKC